MSNSKPVRETIPEKATRLGLTCSSHAPGDGARRYTFHPDARENVILGSARGRAEANVWLNGYAAARKVTA